MFEFLSKDQKGHWGFDPTPSIPTGTSEGCLFLRTCLLLPKDLQCLCQHCDRSAWCCHQQNNGCGQLSRKREWCHS